MRTPSSLEAPSGQFLGQFGILTCSGLVSPVLLLVTPGTGCASWGASPSLGGVLSPCFRCRPGPVPSALTSSSALSGGLWCLLPADRPTPAGLRPPPSPGSRAAVVPRAACGHSRAPRPLIMFIYRERVSGFHRVYTLRTSYTDATLRHSQLTSSFARAGARVGAAATRSNHHRGEEDVPLPPANAAAAQAQAIAPNSPIQPLQGRGRGSRGVFSKLLFLQRSIISTRLLVHRII